MLTQTYHNTIMLQKTITAKGAYAAPECEVLQINLAVNVMSGVLGDANAPGEVITEDDAYTYDF